MCGQPPPPPHQMDLPSLARRGVPQRLGLRASPGGLGAGLLVLLSHRRDGGSSCVGPTRRHRLCHIEVKPTREGGQLPRPPTRGHPGPGCLLSVHRGCGSPFLTPQ